MQLIPSRTLKKAGPSISGLDISAPLELTQDVKPKTQVIPTKKSSNNNTNTAFPPTETSCKPATLSTYTPPPPLPPQSQNKFRHSLPQPNDHHLSSMLVTAMQFEIDDFLHDVQNHGFVLPAHESCITHRLHELEILEHVLSPIAETRDCPGGCNPLTLTYSLPRANCWTKPRGGFIGGDHDGGTVGVGVVGVHEKRTPRPSHAWARLGSRKYYFVDEDRVVRR